MLEACSSKGNVQINNCEVSTSDFINENLQTLIVRNTFKPGVVSVFIQYAITHHFLTILFKRNVNKSELSVVRYYELTVH
jgi:hypothetical protein